jgi:hypothetical protein
MWRFAVPGSLLGWALLVLIAVMLHGCAQPQTQAHLSWDVPAGATYYTVYRGTTPTDLKPIIMTSQPQYVDYPSPGIWSYAVSASNSAGESALSAVWTGALDGQSRNTGITP